ncbi:putative mitochondrial protein [Cucumis melo var. makuwa]|uniref:Mitochondrial protein n=1 Tax=Cucumis melo var. makuwa TaxID=1194695 RepID=A0A5A7TU12_CUCMM|nr:putative mitochondrial protein [Cucumis melo var. makuwa]
MVFLPPLMPYVHRFELEAAPSLEELHTLLTSEKSTICIEKSSVTEASPIAFNVAMQNFHGSRGRGNAIDVFTTNAPTPRNTHATQTRTKSGIFKPKTFHITTTIPTLTSYTEASKYPEWRNTMCEEFNALQAQDTWSLVSRHPSMNIVAVHGFDFDETFSPVVKKPTIQISLALAAQYSWSLTQLDVKNAFLHGILQETVYMSQPTAFQDKTCPNHVCLLHKSLYGLKQRSLLDTATSL